MRLVSETKETKLVAGAIKNEHLMILQGDEWALRQMIQMIKYKKE